MTNTFDNTNILHDTINYVDDSSNIIASGNVASLQTYYNVNKLTINADKSMLIISY